MEAVVPASVFVSHVYEDLQARDAVRAWASQGLLGPSVVITGESSDERYRGQSAIRNHLSPLLQGASAVIVLIGDDTHNHSWVEYEAQHALSNRKTVVVVRIPGTTGAAPANLRGLPEVKMEADTIRLALGT